MATPTTDPSRTSADSATGAGSDWPQPSDTLFAVMALATIPLLAAGLASTSERAWAVAAGNLIVVGVLWCVAWRNDAVLVARANVSDLSWGAAAGVASWAASGVLLWLLPVGGQGSVLPSDVGHVAVAVWVMTGLAVPLAEEVVFRRVMLDTVRQRHPTWLAVLVTAVIFAAMHLDLRTAIGVFPLGVAAGVVAVRRGTVLAAAAAHVLFNAATLAMIARP